MDAKELKEQIERLKIYRDMETADQDDFYIFTDVIEAAEKVETLEAENARIINLVKDVRFYSNQSNAAMDEIERLQKENARLKVAAEKWTDLLKRAGSVGLSEADFFKMVESDKEC